MTAQPVPWTVDGQRGPSGHHVTQHVERACRSDSDLHLILQALMVVLPVRGTRGTCESVTLLVPMRRTYSGVIGPRGHHVLEHASMMWKILGCGEDSGIVTTLCPPLALRVLGSLSRKSHVTHRCAPLLAAGPPGAPGQSVLPPATLESRPETAHVLTLRHYMGALNVGGHRFRPESVTHSLAEICVHPI